MLRRSKGTNRPDCMHAGASKAIFPWLIYWACCSLSWGILPWGWIILICIEFSIPLCKNKNSIETFKSQNKNDLAEGLYALIEGKNVANKQFFENQTLKPYFQKSIQNLNKTNDKPTSEEEKLLFEAYDFFSKRLQQNNLLKELSE